MPCYLTYLTYLTLLVWMLVGLGLRCDGMAKWAIVFFFGDFFDFFWDEIVSPYHPRAPCDMLYLVSSLIEC